MKKLLIVDDEPEMLESFRKILSSRSDYDIQLINDANKALAVVVNNKFDLIITDLKMKNVSGMEVLKAALKHFPETIIIVISGYGTIEASVNAMREGAFDFIEKPFTSKKLFDCIDRAFRQTSDQYKDESIRKVYEKDLSGIIYKSNKIREVIMLAKKVAPGNMNVLITGESGTGKELFARAIFRLSKRKSQPFIPVNCAALPEHLFESELFGHERGAFTGAVKMKPGLLEFANQGTFFFDEIGELSPHLQVKLLRMLEERKIRRVGGQKEIEIDVRILAATNKDLKKAVSDKKFREDLFYRLNTIQIHVPPLRERKEDIIPLANYFLMDLCNKNDKTVSKFSVDAEQALVNYSWPGNVRELQNMIGRAFILCSQEIIQESDLPLPAADKKIAIDSNMLNLSYREAKDLIFEKFEVEYLSYHLKKNKGNISRTAQECGLDRRSIHRLINKYNIIYQDN